MTSSTHHTSHQPQDQPLSDDWWNAIDHHDLNTLETLIQQASPATIQDPRLLQAALAERCIPALQMLVEAGAAPNGLLPFAIQQPDTILLSTLLAHGADPNERDAAGCTPLHLLASRSLFFGDVEDDMRLWLQSAREDPADTNTRLRLDMLQILQHHGADSNAAIAGDGLPANGLFIGATPADVALYTQSQCLLDALLAAQATHATPKDPRLLFHLLSLPAPDFEAPFQALFQCTTEPLALHNKAGETLLHMAIRHNQFTLLNWLLAQGADPNDPGAAGLTPLHLSLYHLTQEHSDSATMQALLQSGADPNKAITQQLPPLLQLLTLAAEIAPPLVLEATTALLTAGASAKASHNAINPLCLTAIHGSMPWELFALLLEHDADLHMPYAGLTALHYLALPVLESPEQQAQRLRNIQTLVKEGAEINALSTQPLNTPQGTIPAGATPMDIAAAAGNEDLLPWFQEAGGAFVMIQDLEDPAQENAFAQALYIVSSDQTEVALQALDQLLHENPDDYEHWMFKGMILFHTQDHQGALQAWLPIERANPTLDLPSEYYVARAIALHSTDRREAALEALAMVPSDHPLASELYDIIHSDAHP